jgi:hypothetical protein
MLWTWEARIGALERIEEGRWWKMEGGMGERALE